MPEDKNEDKKLPASLSGALGDLLTRTFGSAADDFGAYLSDKMRAKRIQNLEAIAKKTHPKLRGLSPKNEPLSLKTALPIFEYASLEEGDYLREKWAALLASNLLDDVPHYFSYILRELTPNDVKLLDTIYDACVASECIPHVNEQPWICKRDDLIEILGFTKEDYGLSGDNLIRLGLCRYPGAAIPRFDEPAHKLEVELTDLGFAFATACKSPKEK